MQEHGWIWRNCNKDRSFTKMGNNLHLYIAWLLLEKAEDAENNRDVNDKWAAWTPLILGKKECYPEIIGTIKNLLCLKVLKEVHITYLSFSGDPNEELAAYASKVLLAEDFDEDNDEEFDGFALGLSLMHPKLDFLRLAILIDSNVARDFIGQCLESWEKGETEGLEADFVNPEKQKLTVIARLAEMFDLYEDEPFSFNASEIPDAVDVFAVLLKLEAEGVIKLSSKRKEAENESRVPKVFQVIRAQAIEFITDAKDLKTKLFSYDCKNDIFRFRGEAIKLKDRNTAFVREFFDLSKDLGVGVDFGELLEAIEPATADMGGAERKNASKAYIYDQRGRLNEKIQEQTKVSEFFILKNNKIYLSNPHCIEVS